MLRYETKVVYFFAFKLTRKKKHHRELKHHHIHLSGPKYISERRFDGHPFYILNHNSLMREANVTTRLQTATECQEPLLAVNGYGKDSRSKYNQSVLRYQYPSPKSGAQFSFVRDKPYPNRPKEYRTVFRRIHNNHFSIQQFQVSSHSSPVLL